MTGPSVFDIFFFFNDTATTEIYTLSLHDALPICERDAACRPDRGGTAVVGARGFLEQPIGVQLHGIDRGAGLGQRGDRKSTRLNSSHLVISYAVFCLKKKKLPAAV